MMSFIGEGGANIIVPSVSNSSSGPALSIRQETADTRWELWKKGSVGFGVPGSELMRERGRLGRLTWMEGRFDAVVFVGE